MKLIKKKKKVELKGSSTGGDGSKKNKKESGGKGEERAYKEQKRGISRVKANAGRLPRDKK